MAYQSDVDTLEDLIANCKSKSLAWQADCIAVLHQVKTMVRPEYLATIQNLVDTMNAHIQECELRYATIKALNAALADVVHFAVERSYSNETPLIDGSQSELAWSLDREACKICGIEIDDGYLDDDYWWCRVNICADECALGAAPHGFTTFHILLDSSAREYLEGKHEAVYFGHMFVKAVFPEVSSIDMPIQQLQGIHAWVISLRTAAFLCAPY